MTRLRQFLLLPLWLPLAGPAPAALAQAPHIGSYEGTATLSGTRLGSVRVEYRAEVKLKLPITREDRFGTVMEQFGSPPFATASARITQWNITARETAASSDGKFDSWTCTLKAPTEVPLTVSGVLQVHTKEGTQSGFMALLSDKMIPLDCTHSRGGSFAKDEGVSFFFGTSEGTLAPYKTQPVQDAGHLTAKFTYVPVAEMKGQEGPLSLEWSLKRMR